MTEKNQKIIPSALIETPSVLSEAQRCLFRPGVLLRMTVAILLCLFAALLPLMIPLGSVLLLVPSTIFVVFPMLFGLAYMGEKAKNGEGLSMRDLFVAFSRRYWYAIRSVLISGLLMLIPLLLVILCAVSAYTVHMLTKATPSVSAYSPFVLLLGVTVTVLSFIPALYLMCPAFFFLAIRVKEQKIRASRTVGLSVRLLARDPFGYLSLQLKYTGLSVLSFLSVCTLFPTYTLPLILIATPLYLDRLIEREQIKSEKIILSQ